MKKNIIMIICFLFILALLPTIILNLNIRDSTTSFLGGYLGAIIAIIGIWYQISHLQSLKEQEFKDNQIKEQLGAINYFIYILEHLKNHIIGLKQISLEYCYISNNVLDERSFEKRLLTESQEKIYLNMYYKLSKEKYATQLLKILEYTTHYEELLNKNQKFIETKTKIYNKLLKNPSTGPSICKLHLYNFNNGNSGGYIGPNQRLTQIRKLNFNNKKNSKIYEKYIGLMNDLLKRIPETEIQEEFLKTTYYALELFHILDNSLNEDKILTFNNYEIKIDDLLVSLKKSKINYNGEQ